MARCIVQRCASATTTPRTQLIVSPATSDRRRSAIDIQLSAPATVEAAAKSSPTGASRFQSSRARSESPSIAFTLSPLKGALLAMKDQLPKGTLVKWDDEGRTYTMFRSPSDASLQISSGELHVAVSMSRDVPVELNGGPVTQDALDKVLALLRRAVRCLAAGSSDAGAGGRSSPGPAQRPRHSTRPTDPYEARRQVMASISKNRIAAHSAVPLRHADRAVVNMRKLTAYALNPDHRENYGKAEAFERRLGFNRDNAGELRDRILEAVRRTPAFLDSTWADRVRYKADLPIRGPKDIGTVRTIWEMSRQGSAPELVTLYVCSSDRYAPRPINRSMVRENPINFGNRR